jgi:hypothetical protein
MNRWSRLSPYCMASTAATYRQRWHGPRQKRPNVRRRDGACDLRQSAGMLPGASSTWLWGWSVDRLIKSAWHSSRPQVTSLLPGLEPPTQLHNVLTHRTFRYSLFLDQKPEGLGR